MRPTLFVFFLTAACGSDKFTSVEAGADGAAACMHELCDDFEGVGEIPGNNPPWSNKQGNLVFTAGNNSKQALEASGNGSSYVKWFLKTGAKGVSCSGDDWLEPMGMDGGGAADARERTLAVIEVDTILDAGTNGTYFALVSSNETKGVGGGAIGPTVVGGWGGSMTVVPLQKWLPFKFEGVMQGTTLQLSAQVGMAQFSGGLNIPTPVTAFRIDIGAASGPPCVIRWDNITCDSR